jgi:hypothetical protein
VTSAPPAGCAGLDRDNFHPAFYRILKAREPYGDRRKFRQRWHDARLLPGPQRAQQRLRRFTGGATQNVTGRTATGAKCVQLTLTFNGNASFNFEPDCAAVGVRGLGRSLVPLVE